MRGYEIRLCGFVTFILAICAAMLLGGLIPNDLMALSREDLDIPEENGN